MALSRTQSGMSSGAEAPVQREGLVDDDSESDAEGERRDAEQAKPGMDMDSLRAVLDDLKECLHAEKAAGRDKDVQLHKLRAERDIVVGARRVPARRAPSQRVAFPRPSNALTPPPPPQRSTDAWRTRRLPA